MKRLIGLAVLALIIDAGVAAAHTGTERGALGFHNVDAPVGIRWWLTDKVGLDGGLGIASEDLGTESVSSFTIDAGLPLMLRSWDRAHFLLRPGILYLSEEEPGTTNNNTAFRVGAELEAEVFLVDQISVSAAHGFAITNVNPAGAGPSFTDWGTTGSNFTTIGFHVYLFGGR